MKIGTMEYVLWISLLLVVLIFPLKSESIEDTNQEDNVDDSAENDYKTKSPEDNNRDDNKDESGNGSTTNTTESVIAVSKIDQTTTTTIQSRPDGMEMAQSGQDGFKDGQKETNIAVKVGVPVALLGLVIVLGIIRLVSSGQLKIRVQGLGRIFGKTPEKSISLYTTNGFSAGNGTNKTSNPIYTLQSGYESIQSERKPTAAYGLDSMEQGIFVYDNLAVLKNDSDSTYQTIADGQLDTSFANFAKSNGQPPAMPQKQNGETAYDNNYF